MPTPPGSSKRSHMGGMQEPASCLWMMMIAHASSLNTPGHPCCTNHQHDRSTKAVRQLLRHPLAADCGKEHTNLCLDEHHAGSSDGEQAQRAVGVELGAKLATCAQQLLGVRYGSGGQKRPRPLCARSCNCNEYHANDLSKREVHINDLESKRSKPHDRRAQGAPRAEHKEVHFNDHACLLAEQLLPGVGSV
jgi:hypothetical protein